MQIVAKLKSLQSLYGDRTGFRSPFFPPDSFLRCAILSQRMGSLKKLSGTRLSV